MTLGKLLAKATGAILETGNISGVCVLCSCETDQGVRLKHVVSGNFTGWSALFSGNCMCPECAYLFSDQVFRKKSWVASPTGFRTFKNDEAKAVLFDPPEPPFFVYIAKRGQRQSWLCCLHRVSHNRNRYFFGHESYGVPILFERQKAAAYSDYVSLAIDEHGISKTELVTGRFKPKTWEKAFLGGYDSFLRKLECFKENPLWEVIVDVHRRARSKDCGAVGIDIQCSSMAEDANEQESA